MNRTNTTVLHTYRVFGLGLQANRSIAGLRALPPAPRVDVCLWLGLMPPELENLRADDAHELYRGTELDPWGNPDVWVDRVRGGEFLRLTYSDGTVFAIDAEYRTIWATWPEPATVEDTATYLLGPVLGYLLRLRGVTCLHASAVAIGDRSIALVGASGAGKSSTAAAFAQRGCPVLSDDVVALLECDGGFAVQPGYPRLRLWPDTVHGLFGSPDALPRITPTWGKRFLDLNGPDYRFQATPLPLAAIYVLGERSDAPPYVEDIHPRSALMTLVSDTYGTNLLDPPRRATEFGVLGRLVGQVGLRQVRASTDLARMSDLCRAIIDDVQRTVLATVEPSSCAVNVCTA